MAFAKAEALTMVCMKNRFWTLIAFGGYGVYSPQPFSLLICWGFPALEHPAHSRRRLLLGGEVQVGIDVGGGGEGAVAQPDLDLFHRDAVTQKKAGACVSNVMETYLS